MTVITKIQYGKTKIKVVSRRRNKDVPNRTEKQKTMTYIIYRSIQYLIRNNRIKINIFFTQSSNDSETNHSLINYAAKYKTGKSLLFGSFASKPIRVYTTDEPKKANHFKQILTTLLEQ